MAIRITEEQLEKLRPYVLDNYISELVKHCDQSFPYLKQTMGEDALKKALRLGIDKAQMAGFTERASVQFYIDLLILFGYEFDTDPQYEWLQAFFRKYKALPQFEQVSLLYIKIKRYLNFTLGENKQLLAQASVRFNSLNIEQLKTHKSSLIENILYLLDYIYPEKYDLLGREVLERLVINVVEKARTEYKLTQVGHISLISILTFLFGYQFNQDPFCFWLIKDQTIESDTKVIEPLNEVVLVNKLDKSAQRGLKLLVNSTDN